MTKLTTFSKSSAFPCTPEELYIWHSRPGALQRLTPPWDKSKVIGQHGGIDPGAEAFVQIRVGPFPRTWHARHIQADPGRLFQDIQEKGPFSKWEHTHLFSKTAQGCKLEDSIRYRLPAQALLPQFVDNHVRSTLERMFTYRHNTLREDITSHQKYSSKPLRILVTGGSGTLGQALAPFLSTGGHEVWFLVRRKPQHNAREVYWNPAQDEIDDKALPPIDGVIHLAGENIGSGRWTAQKKQRIIDSRVQGTGLIARTIAAMNPRPKVMLSASAVGFYGDCMDCLITEEAPAGNDFISEVCSLWESAAAPAKQAGIRTVLLRIGVVLTPRGGALQRLLYTRPFGFARCFGTGDQYISWISIDDMINAILHALVTDSLEGPVNIAAPAPATNRELLHTLAEIAGLPLLPGVPAGLLKAVYGQMATEVLLSGCRVTSEKLEQSGFTFRHPTLQQALSTLLGKQ